VASGRSSDARPPNDEELRQTSMFAIVLDEASAKVRVGPPIDDEQDLSLPIWAGVLPLRIEPSEPIASPDLQAGISVPGYLESYRRPGDTP